MKYFLQRPLTRPLTVVVLLLLGGCPIYGWDYEDDDDFTQNPVYLSYTDLRTSTQVQAARTVNSIGRIYLYDNYFFLNEKNIGIHIFDNTNPSNPRNTGFISIPGNTEISIRDKYLYADSYVDLVTIDLNNLASIQEVDREENVFPWDPYQNVPDSVYFSSSQLDETRGVVVSHE